MDEEILEEIVAAMINNRVTNNRKAIIYGLQECPSSVRLISRSMAKMLYQLDLGEHWLMISNSHTLFEIDLDTIIDLIRVK